MEEFLKDLESHTSYVAIGGLLTFLTVLFTFYTQVAIPMYNKTIKPVVDLFSAVVESPRRITSLDSKLDLILEELKPNGGGSIKDQLNRLEGSVSISEAQRLLILDSNPSGIWTSDKTGKLVWMNATLKTALGVTDLDDVKGDNWVNVIHPSDRKFVIEEWEDAVAHQRTFTLHYRLANLKTGAAVPVQGVATPAKSYDNTLVGFNGIIYFR